MFLIYINDLDNVLEKCEIVFYADETLIFLKALTNELCYENLRMAMNKINKWLKLNKLKLKESKTKMSSM